MILTDRLDIKNLNGYSALAITIQWISEGNRITITLDKGDCADLDITVLERLAVVPGFVTQFKKRIKALGDIA